VSGVDASLWDRDRADSQRGRRDRDVWDRPPQQRRGCAGRVPRRRERPRGSASRITPASVEAGDPRRRRTSPRRLGGVSQRGGPLGWHRRVDDTARPAQAESSPKCVATPQHRTPRRHRAASLDAAHKADSRRPVRHFLAQSEKAAPTVDLRPVHRLPEARRATLGLGGHRPTETPAPTQATSVAPMAEVRGLCTAEPLRLVGLALTTQRRLVALTPAVSPWTPKGEGMVCGRTGSERSARRLTGDSPTLRTLRRRGVAPTRGAPALVESSGGGTRRCGGQRHRVGTRWGSLSPWW
jgi:hypothetical protein